MGSYRGRKDRRVRGRQKLIRQMGKYRGESTGHVGVYRRSGETWLLVRKCLKGEVCGGGESESRTQNTSYDVGKG